MPITFGSVGDIITLSLLIKDLVKCLDESRGSSKEYQAVIRELWSLEHALLEVELLLRSCKQSVELSDLCKAAKRCAEQCRDCIEDFRDKTKKYQRALQGGGSRNLVRDTTAKIRWHVSEKDDLAAFRAVIMAHCSSLNILLATAGFKLAILNDEGMHKRLKQSDLAHASSSATQTSLLVDLNTRLEKTSSLIQAAVSETKALGSKTNLDNFRNIGGSAGEADKSFDEEMPNQPKQSLNKSFDKNEKLFRSRPPPAPPRFWKCNHCGEGLNSLKINMYCTNPACGKRKDVYWELD